MSQFLSYVLPGVPYGCAYALMAVGLVLTYRVSGVFNLAFGAQAYVSAVVFYVTVHDGWPKWAAFVVAVVLLGPAVGVVLDRALFRFTRTAPPLVKLVPALGLLIAIPSAVQMIIGTASRRSPPALLFNPTRVYFHLTSLGVTGEEIATTVVTVAVVVVLVAALRSGTVGLRMRAVVESPRLVELAGIRADRVSAFAWMLSSLLAGLSGVLLATVYTDLSASNFTALLVAAIAAAAVGGFSSLPFTLVGGVALGVAQEVIGGYLPSGTILSSGVRPAFPFVVLAVLLVVRRTFHQPAGGGDPLAGVDPPAPSVRPPRRLAEVQTGSRAFSALLAAVFIVVAIVFVPANWEFTLTQGLVLSVVFLSITLLTGMGGMISLCQAVFAGVGAFTAGQLAMHFNVPVMIGTVAGGLLAAVVGAVVSLPTLRLGGIPLALLTLSFALVADNVLFQYAWAGNGATGVTVPRPTIFGASFAGNAAFFWLALVVLVLAATAVRFLKGGTVGEQLAAFRGSQTAASAIGVDVRRLRVTAFTLSAAVAGLGGAMYGTLQGSVSPTDFNYQFSLVFMVVVATVGVYTVAGAIEAGVAYTVLQQLIANLPPRYGSFVALLFGVAALTYVRHPEGAVAFAKGWVLDHAEQLAHRLKGTPATSAGDGDGDAPGRGRRAGDPAGARAGG